MTVTMTGGVSFLYPGSPFPIFFHPSNSDEEGCAPFSSINSESATSAFSVDNLEQNCFATYISSAILRKWT